MVKVETFAVYPDKCAGCMACSDVCSLVKEGEVRPGASRIKVVRREWQGIYFPVVCQQCAQQSCATACPEGAIGRDARTGATIVDREKCDLCGACVRACPYGAIHVDGGAMIVCDLCGGRPRCVEWCPHGAIKYLHLTPSQRKNSMTEILKLKKVSGYKAAGVG